MVDHVRGPASSPVIVEYGDHECPYSRQAYREIERVETELVGGVRFAFRHFPLTQTHPHALATAAAAEAAARQGRFWDMHELLFHRQKALDEHDLQQYAADIGWEDRLATGSWWAHREPARTASRPPSPPA
jgi:protein-disulfide isomerase